MQEDIIRSYFKDGVKRGFGKDYLRSALLRRGYDSAIVQMVYNTMKDKASEVPKSVSSPIYTPFKSKIATVPPMNPLSPHHPSSPFPPSRLFIYVALMILIVGGVYLVVQELKIDSPTGYAVIQDQEAALQEITELDKKIEEKQESMQAVLDELSQKELTIEEKNKIIEQYSRELMDLHDSIKEERTKIRELLFDLLNSIVERPMRQKE